MTRLANALRGFIGPSELSITRSSDRISGTVLRLALAAAMLVSATAISLGSGDTRSLVGASSSVSSPAVADAYVTQSAPGTNFGASSALRTDSYPAVLRSYLRFDLSQLSGTVLRATLRVYAGSSNSMGYEVRTAGNEWSEDSITFSNAPALGPLLGSSGGHGAAVWTAVDVTPLLGGTVDDEAVTLALTTNSMTMTRFSSRESGANRPQLVVTTESTSPPPQPEPSPAPQPAPSPAPQPEPTGVQPTPPIRAAFYYPWFPEAWNQKSTFPYTNFSPTLGHYDSGNADVIREHIQAMQYGGIEAGIASWWDQGSRTDNRVNALLQGAGGTPFRWTIYYEPEGYGDPTVAEITSDLEYIRDRYAGNPSFLRIDGKFVVFVYGNAADGCGTADRWKQANTVEAHVVLKVFSGYRTCASQPQGWHQYAPAVATDSQGTYSYSISPGFWLKGDNVRLARDLPRWTQSVRDMAASQATFHLITTFNEWGEGTSVESAREWASASGFGAYLDVLHLNGTASDPIPSPTPTPSPTPAPSPAPTPSPSPGAGDPIVAAAGDIACDPASSSFNGGSGTSSSCRQKATSELLLNMSPTAVLPLGDTQYEDGALDKFEQSYDPSWGRVKAITRPAVGNHEYLTPGATGYFDYFGAAAGDRSRGYYSYDVGSWHLVALNSNCSAVGGCDTASPQLQWLRADLVTHPATCTLAYWHHPRFSSGAHGSDPSYTAFWQALWDAKAEIVLNGHDHLYERFAPQDPNGAQDMTRGIRQFTVGTGGKNHVGVATVTTNSEVRNADTYGVLKLTLHASSYDFQFVPEPGGTLTDSGSGTCH
jgi:acid phosphatase type 7